MAEIPEDQYKILAGSKALLDKLLGSPKTRRQAEKLIKEHFPDTVTSDDMAEPLVKGIEEKVDQIAKDFKSFKDDIVGKNLDSKLEAGIKRLREEQDFTDDGIEKLKKLMVEREIPNIEDAAKVWNYDHPPKPQEASILGPTDWGFGRDHSKDEDLKLLFEDEDAWAEQEARRIWAEETAKKGQILT